MVSSSATLNGKMSQNGIFSIVNALCASARFWFPFRVAHARENDIQGADTRVQIGRAHV